MAAQEPPPSSPPLLSLPPPSPPRRFSCRRVRLVHGQLHRAEERLLDEQVRAAVAEERWQPLIRQRDDAMRERSRAARALNALHAEKRELQWAMGDLRHGVGSPLRAWDVPSVTQSGRQDGGFDVPPFPRTSASFSTSPYGIGKASPPSSAARDEAARREVMREMAAATTAPPADLR